MTNERKPLVIAGAGGFGLEVAAYAAEAGFAVRGFLDDTKPAGALHAGYPVLGGTDSAIDSGAAYVVALGDPAGRRLIVEKLAAGGAVFARLIHPRSYVAPDAEIGDGTVIAPFAFVGPAAQIGAHSVLNVSAMAGHETRIGAYAVMAPQSSLQGKAGLGSGGFIGGHACVMPGVKIGENAKIAAGAVAYNDIPAGVTALGNPAAYRLKP